ncbi:unnamed protein product [Acidithrix sp. C25]|nr:unnamed protein product [Acidithrix sp. C25]
MHLKDQSRSIVTITYISSYMRISNRDTPFGKTNTKKTKRR